MNTQLTASHWGAYEIDHAQPHGPQLKAWRGDPDPSPIGLAMLDAYRHGPRVLRPAVRQSWLEHGPGARPELRGREPFVEVSWEQALDLVAGDLKRVIETHGNEAIFGGSYGWASAGRFHHAQSQLRRFMHQVGGCVVHTQSYSIAAALVILPHVVGSMDELALNMTTWDVMAQHTRLCVCFGGMPWKNAQVGVGGAFEHRLRPGLELLAKSGVRFVNFSPTRTDLQVPGDGLEWIPIRPNTDTAVMLALAFEIIRAGRHDAAFLQSHCVGFEKWRAYVLGESDGVPKTAEWAGALSGVDPARLRALALDMAQEVDGRRTMLNTTWAPQRADHGEQPYWGMVSLAAVIGHIGLPGGGFGVGYGCENGLGSPHPLFVEGPRMPAPPNPVKTSIPVARISDMLLNPGAPYQFNGEDRHYPDIKMLYWVGGNPFHHHQDLNRMRRAWHKPETIVVHEQVWNAQAKFADIVLPATTSLEREDIGFAYREPVVIAMKQVVQPLGEARDDHAIFDGIARRMGLGEGFSEGRTPVEWQRLMWEKWREASTANGFEVPSFDDFREAGVWTVCGRDRLNNTHSVVMLEDFRRDPTAHPLKTPSGRIELFSEKIASFGYDDCPGHVSWLEPVEWLGAPLAQRFSLHLISDQPERKLHSQLDFSTHSRAGKINGREPAWLHPADAAARGIAEGDLLRVFNDRGACLATAVLTDAVARGVLKLCTGGWYDPLDVNADDSLCRQGNPNVLTRDAGTSRLAQGSVAHSCLVQAERWQGEDPGTDPWSPPAGVSRNA